LIINVDLLSFFRIQYHLTFSCMGMCNVPGVLHFGHYPHWIFCV